MTPPAATAAGRRKPRNKAAAAKASRKAAGRAKVTSGARKAGVGHGARTLRRSSAPRISRRVSGPAGGRGAAAAAAVLPRPQHAPLGPRLVAFATTLPDRGVVDRMVRGRVWIGVLGVLLIGLVFTQVSLLKLNAGIGSAVERSAGLERINGELRAQVSQLESGERIQERAAALGMILPAAGQISYVRARGRDDVGAATRALDENGFNDPAKATPLPGTNDPPDPLTSALAEPDKTSEDTASTDQGSSADQTTSIGDSGSSTDSTAADGQSTGATESDGSTATGDGASTAAAEGTAAVSGGTGTDGAGQ